MAYEKKEQLYEGKAKKVYATDDPNVVIVSYKDDATAFNGQKKGTITGKGAINNRMTNNLMRRLEAAGIPHPLCGGAQRPGDRGEEGVHRPSGGHHPQHLRRLLRQALRRGGGHRVRRAHHRVLL